MGVIMLSAIAYVTLSTGILATTIAQGVDTVVFVMIGFWGRMEGIGQFILVYWALKVTISVFDTPIVYLARRMTPFEE